jgi:membrane protease YdiL (CAAX protease family)
MFGLAHFGPDFIPALLTGAIYNLLAVKTRSLACCVLAHAVTNLGLGLSRSVSISHACASCSAVGFHSVIQGCGP